MKLGDLQTIEVEDVKLLCRVTYGEYKKMQKEINDLPDPKAEGGPEAWLEYTEKKLLELTVRVEGLEDAEGKPVEKLSRKIIEELPAGFVAEAFEGITNAGNRTGA